MTKYKVMPSSRFQKDLRRLQRRGFDMTRISDVIKLLAEGADLPPKYRDHALIGDYIGFRECHIAPDWLLIYKRSSDILILSLTRTGSHSDLFC